ncbi:HTH-type transcriptional regulator BenM [compost metagenome]
MSLSEDRLAVAMPTDHPLASNEAIELSELADETLVMASRDVSPVYFDYLVGLCKASGFAPRIVHQVRSVSSQVAFVSCGQGIALVPTSMDKLAPENVLVRPLQPEVKVVTTAMAWHGVVNNPLVDAMIDQATQIYPS